MPLRKTPALQEEIRNYKNLGLVHKNFIRQEYQFETGLKKEKCFLAFSKQRTNTYNIDVEVAEVPADTISRY